MLLSRFMQLAEVSTQNWWRPPQASTFSRSVDNIYLFIFWVCLVFFVGIAVTMFWFMIKYRRRTPEDEVGHTTHSNTLELVWTIIPSLLLIPMFWWGFTAFMDTRIAPGGAYEIQVKAQKWNWTFLYPNGGDTDELHLPVGRPVRLIMRSEDVIHSLFIPAFRQKRDIPPGRYTDIWFQATQTGKFWLTCAEYCGTNHSDMKADVYVEEQSVFEEWLKNMDPLSKLTPEQYQEFLKDPTAFIGNYKDDPVLGKVVTKLATHDKMGEQLYNRKGCKQCHSIDGSTSTGPTWKGVFGRAEKFVDGGGVTVDENYVRESILEPNKHVVAGFQAVMPKIAVKDREIDMLIAYIKTLK